MRKLILSFPTAGIVALSILGVLLLALALVVLTRYKKCPKSKAIVVYGACLGSNPDGKPRQAKIICKGSVFVLPILQSYSYLDLTPFSLKAETNELIANTGESVKFVANLKLYVPKDELYLQNAAERLLGCGVAEIQTVAEQIAIGEIQKVVSTWDSESIEKDKYKIFDKFKENLSNTLKLVGLKIQDANLSDLYKVKNN